MTPAFDAAEFGSAPVGPPLDRRRKAAIVVRFLLPDGQRPPLATLPEDAQVDLTCEMAQLRLVDRGSVRAMIASGEITSAIAVAALHMFEVHQARADGS